MPVLARNAATTTASTTAEPRPVAIRPTPALLPLCVSRPAGFLSLPYAPLAPPRPRGAVPRVVVLVDAVAEAHQLELTGFHPGDVAGHAVRGSDLAEHA